MSEIDSKQLAVLVELAEEHLGEYGFSQTVTDNEKQLSAIRAGYGSLGEPVPEQWRED